MRKSRSPVARLPRAAIPWLLAVLLASTGCEAAPGSRSPVPEPEPTSAPGEATGTFEHLPERVRHVQTGIVLIRVPPGRFVMGSPPEEKHRDADEEQHEVVFDAPFWLAETEVSVGLWNEVMDIDPWDPVRTDLPASDVSWHEAQEFLRRLNEREGGGWRLPTEAEWEYACRAGTTTPFSFGADVFPWQANYDDRYPYAHERGAISPGTVPVGSLPANPWGFHEMHGNVKEWCQDVYRFRHADPPVSTEDPGASRVLRGGDWVSGGHQLRSAYRDGYPPNTEGGQYGLRLARSSAP